MSVIITRIHISLIKKKSLNSENNRVYCVIINHDLFQVWTSITCRIQM